MSILFRIYQDFFMPSQLNKWMELLSLAQENGYEFVTIRDFASRIKEGSLTGSGKKYFLIRHDVDSCLNILKDMWRVEKKMGIRSTYYFRLSTIDIPLMREIELSGSEASYHFEELATFAKRRGMTCREDLEKHLGEIRILFKENIDRLRTATGLPMTTVASHGDFANRKLGIINHVILKDTGFRRECHIDLEAYDEDFMRFVTSRHADGGTPRGWRPHSPSEAIRRDEPVIYCLVHPCCWGSNFIENFGNNLYRLREELAWNLRRLSNSRKGNPGVLC